jgi:hypothetical protein
VLEATEMKLPATESPSSAQSDTLESARVRYKCHL